MRWTLAIVFLLTCWLESGRGFAQDEIGLGGLRLSAYPGYSYYALPVANAGIGRDWVNSTDLQWQIGYNYSVVPVRIEFEHRMPNAFKGRIEIESPDSFYPEEASGTHPAVYSQEILVPPSVPQSFMFAPRICPPSQVMGPVEFTVRLYKSGSEKPYFTHAVSAIQLEPGYLHSLWLDGITDTDGNPAVLTDYINPDNRLRLKLPGGYAGLSEILSSTHFVIAVDHEQVTGLPLAARDFAFVVADLAQVRQWTADEQSALVSFMAGGGHLCLYNSGDEQWMGLELNQPSAVGRGFLIPVQGKMIEARQAMVLWLEGELEEFVLWSGGASPDWKIGEEVRSGSFGRAIGFLKEFSEGASSQKVISHRPGYLNPIWIYREACRSGSQEAWESALTLSVESPGGNNVPSTQQTGSPSKPTVKLGHLATPTRMFPPTLLPVLIVCPLLVVINGLLRKRRMYATGLLTMIIVFGLYSTITTNAVSPGHASLVLVDVDARCEAGSIRTVTATSSGANGVIRAILPQTPLVRHLALDNHAPWQITQGKYGSEFSITSPGSRAVLSSDAIINFSGEIPVSVSVTEQHEDWLTCSVDTSKLAAGAKCLVQLPSGWFVLHGGEETSTVSFQIPQFTCTPGTARLHAWSDYFERIRPPTRDRMYEVLRDAKTSQKIVTEELDTQEELEGLKRLGWNHLTKLSTGLRGTMQNQGVIYVESSSPQLDTELEGHKVVFWRITFPLEVRQ